MGGDWSFPMKAFLNSPNLGLQYASAGEALMQGQTGQGLSPDCQYDLVCTADRLFPAGDLRIGLEVGGLSACTSLPGILDMVQNNPGDEVSFEGVLPFPLIGVSAERLIVCLKRGIGPLLHTCCVCRIARVDVGHQ
eukprot:TRINITY_DN11996_c0_g1_i1.p3 TRINITY_DN11996_c0_g1~~TRINITY_DN11996_c0_g1_i1.p3  ORF type:complete len:136 (+),score=18.61 TRINITY_DN11996_c0_g1_i1:355-762(+)